MINCHQLAELKVFREFYYIFQRLFGLDIALLDSEGRQGALLGEGRELNRFCVLLQRMPEALRQCRECDARNALNANKSQRPLRYVCYAGLTEFMIPIVVNGLVVAHLQCGQVTERALTVEDWRRVRARLGRLNGLTGSLRRVYYRTPVISAERQRDIVALLRLFAQHAALAHIWRMELDQAPSDRIVGKALALVANRFHEPVRLNEVGRACGASARNLSRLLRKRTGESLVEHLHRIRIEHACELLGEGEATTAEIALRCGFGSIQQFNRVFKDRMGDTPTGWLKQRFRDQG